MKKIKLISIILTVVVLICNLGITVFADNEVCTSEVIEFFDDGSYAVITITETSNNTKATTKTGSKKYTYKNSEGDTQWEYIVTGTFSYNYGVSSTCTNVSDSYSIVNDNWHMYSHSCYKSGNTAYGNVTMKYKVFGFTTDTVKASPTLTCNIYGVLS